MKNIVLIGMPGSGKTTVGLLLARQLGRRLLDTDAMVAAAEGRPIPALFSNQGESYFRDAETSAAKRAAAETNTVIATGGGMVLRPENMTELGRTGIVCFLDRPPELLTQTDHSGRPLIGADADRIFALYRQRIGLYRTYAQITVDNSGAPEQAAELLMNALEGML